MHLLTDPQVWAAFFTLTALEIVLGIDNIIFLSILVSRLPDAQRDSARRFGLLLAMLTRLGLLFSLTWMMGLTSDLFTVFTHGISGRDLVLLAGGLFLIAKSTSEIHQSLEGEEGHGEVKARGASFLSIVIQIAIIDIVFSLDSVITAVGLARDLPVMVAAIVCAVLVMLWAAKPIGDFVDAHPTVRVLALAFLLLVGFALMGEGVDLEIPKGYIYFAMAFSVGVEMLNLRLRKRAAAPVRLHKQDPEDVP